MHGLDGNYNAQELANVFEADKTYTFSLWAQYDVNCSTADGLVCMSSMEMCHLARQTH